MWQIVEKKDPNDRPTINWIYNTQYPSIKSYELSIFSDLLESAELETIQLIFEMNFDMSTPSELIADILDMCKTWESSNGFNSSTFLGYDSEHTDDF